MWKDWGKDQLEDLIFVLNNIIADLEQSDHYRTPGQIYRIANGFSEEITKEIKAVLSQIFKVPEFLLDIEEAKQVTYMIEPFQNWRKRVLDHIELQQHPDNLPELLYGQREFGCVYLSTQLLKRLHCLGEAVLKYRKSKNEMASKEVERQILEIMIESSEWVAYTKRKWGIMSDTELAIVSPLTKEDVKNARPNVETDPPF
jgi:hypothetical protein